MSELIAQVTPGKVFTDTELITADGLNQLGVPTITLTGLVGAETLGANAVFTDAIQDEAVTLEKLAVAVQAMLGSSTAMCGTRDLTIAPYTGAETRKVQITAAEAILKNASGLALCKKPVSVTADFEAGVGAGGIDATGIEAADTWFYLWLIAKPDLTTAGIISLSDGISTGLEVPTLPTGYTYYSLVGAIYNNDANNIRRFYQRDQYVAQLEVALIYGYIETSYREYDLTEAVPVTAKAVIVNTRGDDPFNVVCVAVDELGTGAQELKYQGSLIVTLNGRKFWAKGVSSFHNALVVPGFYL